MKPPSDVTARVPPLPFVAVNVPAVANKGGSPASLASRPVAAATVSAVSGVVL